MGFVVDEASGAQLWSVVRLSSGFNRLVAYVDEPPGLDSVVLCTQNLGRSPRFVRQTPGRIRRCVGTTGSKVG